MQGLVEAELVERAQRMVTFNMRARLQIIQYMNKKGYYTILHNTIWALKALIL